MGRHGIIHFSVAFGSVKSGGHTRQPFPSFCSIAAPVLFGCLDENSPHLDNPSGLLWCCPLVFKKATKSILRLDWFRGQLPLVSILQKNREMETKQSRQTYRPCGVETLVFPCSFNHGSWGNSHGEGFLNSLSNGTSGNCLLVKGGVMLSWVRCPGVEGGWAIYAPQCLRLQFTSACAQASSSRCWERMQKTAVPWDWRCDLKRWRTSALCDRPLQPQLRHFQTQCNKPTKTTKENIGRESR